VMKWPLLTLSLAIVIGVTVQMAGSYASADARSPTQQSAPANSFAVTTSGQSPIMAWLINTTTGAVSVCYSSDPNSAPRCTPWSTD
jgi:hypothetical protein